MPPDRAFLKAALPWPFGPVWPSPGLFKSGASLALRASLAQKCETQKRKTQVDKIQKRKTQIDKTKKRKTQIDETQNGKTQIDKSRNGKTQIDKSQNGKTQIDKSQNVFGQMYEKPYIYRFLLLFEKTAIYRV